MSRRSLATGSGNVCRSEKFFFVLVYLIFLFIAQLLIYLIFLFIAQLLIYLIFLFIATIICEPDLPLYCTITYLPDLPLYCHNYLTITTVDTVTIRKSDSQHSTDLSIISNDVFFKKEDTEIKFTNSGVLMRKDV